MRIIDVVNNLEAKLNKAIISTIASKEGEATPLETDRYTTRFILHPDTGRYKGFEWLKRTAQPNSDGYYDNSAISQVPTNKFVQLINGAFFVVGSNVEGGVTAEQTAPKNLAFTASIVFFVPIENGTDDTELITSIRDVIDGAMSLNQFSDFDGYNMSVVYTLGATGERMTEKGIGDFITIRCNLEYAFVEGGINSTQILIKYQNSLIYAPVKALSRVASQEGNVDLTSGNSATKNVTQSTTLTLTLDKPLQKGAFDDICTLFIANGDTGAIYPIEITIPNSQGEITFTANMSFNSVQMNMQNTLNTGLSIVMGEAMEV